MRSSIALIALLGGLVAGVATADDHPPAQGAAIKGDAAAVAKYRHNAFEGLGKHMKVSSMMVKGELELTQADMVLHARAMNDTAKAMPGWFPAGTGPDKTKTDSLANIWTDRAGFDAKVAAFDKASAELLAKAEANDPAGFKAAFKAVGQSCGDCHDTFRKDEDH